MPQKTTGFGSVQANKNKWCGRKQKMEQIYVSIIEIMYGCEVDTNEWCRKIQIEIQNIMHIICLWVGLWLSRMMWMCNLFFDIQYKTQCHTSVGCIVIKIIIIISHEQENKMQRICSSNDVYVSHKWHAERMKSISTRQWTIGHCAFCGFLLR